MKRRICALVCFAVILLFGFRVLAAGGSSGDPVISLSYLNGVFRAKLETMMTE